MRGKIALATFVVLVFAGSHAARVLLLSDSRREPLQAAALPDGKTYERIVSLAPSITETLYALDLGDNIVGVTGYCDYPPEALAKDKIGDYLKPNYEAVVMLRPDLVIALAENARVQRNLSGLGLTVLPVNHKTLFGILESISTIGELCGRQDRAGQVRSDMETRIDRVRKMAAGLSKKPRVMISIGRTFGASALTKVCIAGQDGFYNEMLKLAGAVNVYEDTMIKFPEIAAEGVLALDPDVIIDLDPEAYDDRARQESILKEWQTMTNVRAVRNGRVHVLTGIYVMRPGPRSVRILEDIAQAIHGEPDRKN